LVIDVDVATLLQAQLGETLGVGANATIFEICAAIDAEGLDITAVINALELDLDPIVTAQISDSKSNSNSNQRNNWYPNNPRIN
jgi:hypothetical protein